jgi:hypothetical protein
VGGFASVAASESRRADPKVVRVVGASAALRAARAILIPTTTSAAPPATWNHWRASPLKSAAAPSPASSA